MANNIIDVGVNIKQITSAVSNLGKEFEKVGVSDKVNERFKSLEEVVRKLEQSDSKTTEGLRKFASVVEELNIKVRGMEGSFKEMFGALSKTGQTSMNTLKESISGVTKLTGSLVESTQKNIKAVNDGAAKAVKIYKEIREGFQSPQIVKENDLSAIFGDVKSFDKLSKLLREDIEEVLHAEEEFKEADRKSVGEEKFAKMLKRRRDAALKYMKDIRAVEKASSKGNPLAEDFYDQESGQAKYDVPKEFVKRLQVVFSDIEEVQDENADRWDTWHNVVIKSYKTIDDEAKLFLESIKESFKEIDNVVSKSAREVSENDIGIGAVIKKGTEAELADEIKVVISRLQSYADAHDIKLNLDFKASWGSKNTNKYLKNLRDQVSSQLKGRVDTKEYERVLGMVNKLEDAFGEDFANSLSAGMRKIQDRLSQEKDGLSINKINLSEKAITDLQDQLDKKGKDLSITVKNADTKKATSENIKNQTAKVDHANIQIGDAVINVNGATVIDTKKAQNKASSGDSKVTNVGGTEDDDLKETARKIASADEIITRNKQERAEIEERKKEEDKKELKLKQSESKKLQEVKKYRILSTEYDKDERGQRHRRYIDVSMDDIKSNISSSLKSYKGKKTGDIDLNNIFIGENLEKRIIDLYTSYNASVEVLRQLESKRKKTTEDKGNIEKIKTSITDSALQIQSLLTLTDENSIKALISKANSLNAKDVKGNSDLIKQIASAYIRGEGRLKSGASDLSLDSLGKNKTVREAIKNEVSLQKSNREAYATQIRANEEEKEISEEKISKAKEEHRRIEEERARRKALDEQAVKNRIEHQKELEKIQKENVKTEKKQSEPTAKIIKPEDIEPQAEKYRDIIKGAVEKLRNADASLLDDYARAVMEDSSEVSKNLTKGRKLRRNKEGKYLGQYNSFANIAEINENIGGLLASVSKDPNVEDFVKLIANARRGLGELATLQSSFVRSGNGLTDTEKTLQHNLFGILKGYDKAKTDKTRDKIISKAVEVASGTSSLSKLGIDQKYIDLMNQYVAKEKAKAEAERIAKEEADRIAKAEKEKAEAEKIAKAEAEHIAKVEKEKVKAEKATKVESESIVRAEKEKAEADKKAKVEVDRLAKATKEKTEADKQAKIEEEREAKTLKEKSVPQVESKKEAKVASGIKDISETKKSIEAINQHAKAVDNEVKVKEKSSEAVKKETAEKKREAKVSNESAIANKKQAEADKKEADSSKKVATTKANSKSVDTKQQKIDEINAKATKYFTKVLGKNSGFQDNVDLKKIEDISKVYSGYKREITKAGGKALPLSKLGATKNNWETLQTLKKTVDAYNSQAKLIQETEKHLEKLSSNEKSASKQVVDSEQKKAKAIKKTNEEIKKTSNVMADKPVSAKIRTLLTGVNAKNLSSNKDKIEEAVKIWRSFKTHRGKGSLSDANVTSDSAVIEAINNLYKEKYIDVKKSNKKQNASDVKITKAKEATAKAAEEMAKSTVDDVKTTKKNTNKNKEKTQSQKDKEALLKALSLQNYGSTQDKAAKVFKATGGTLKTLPEIDSKGKATAVIRTKTGELVAMSSTTKNGTEFTDAIIEANSRLVDKYKKGLEEARRADERAALEISKENWNAEVPDIVKKQINTLEKSLGAVKDIYIQTREDYSTGNLLRSFRAEFANGNFRTVNERGETIASKTAVGEVENLLRILKELNKQSGTYLELKGKAEGGIATEGEIQRLAILESEYKKIVKLIQAAQDALKDYGVTSVTADKTFANYVGGINLNFNEMMSKYTANARKKIEDRVAKVGENRKGFTSETLEGINEAYSKLNAIENLISQHGVQKPWDIVDQEDVSELGRIFNYIEEIDSLMADIKSKNNVLVPTGEVDKLISKLRGTQFESLKIPKETKNEFRELLSYLEKVRLDEDRATESIKGNYDTLASLSKLTEGRYKDIAEYVNTLVSQTKGIDKNIFAKISRSLSAQIAQFFAMYASPYDLLRYAREAIETIRQIDTAMVELKKVSDATSTQIDNDFGKMSGIAKEYGSTISNIISLTADWSRLGYNLPDSEELARVTQLYTNVGDGISSEQASESLISTLQGFKLAASEAESIIDKFNEVKLLLAPLC